jgi:hypothetical protein
MKHFVGFFEVYTQILKFKNFFLNFFDNNFDSYKSKILKFMEQHPIFTLNCLITIEKIIQCKKTRIYLNW